MILTLEYTKKYLIELYGRYECITREEIFKAFNVSVSRLEKDDRSGLLKRSNPKGQPRYSASEIHRYLTHEDVGLYESPLVRANGQAPNIALAT